MCHYYYYMPRYKLSCAKHFFFPTKNYNDLFVTCGICVEIRVQNLKKPACVTISKWYFLPETNWEVSLAFHCCYLVKVKLVKRNTKIDGIGPFKSIHTLLNRGVFFIIFNADFLSLFSVEIQHVHT